MGISFLNVHDVLQNYLLFISVNKYTICFLVAPLKFIHENNITSEEKVENIAISDNTFVLTLIDSYPLPDVKFGGQWFINSNISAFRIVINLYISYILHKCSRDSNTDFTLGNCLFGDVKVTKNADPDIYGYNDYGIGFDARSKFSLPDGSWGKMLLFLELMIALMCILIAKRKISQFLMKEETWLQVLHDTTITVEAKYPILA